MNDGQLSPHPEAGLAGEASREPAGIHSGLRLLLLIALATIAARALLLSAIAAGLPLAASFGHVIQPALTVALFLAAVHIFTISPLILRLRALDGQNQQLGSIRQDLQQQLARCQNESAAAQSQLETARSLVRKSEEEGREQLQAMNQKLAEQAAHGDARANALQSEVVRLTALVGTLRESDGRYRHLAEIADECFWTLDTKGKTSFINRRAAELLGYQPAEIIGRPASDFLVVEDLPVELRSFNLEHGSMPDPVEFRLLRKDAGEAWVRASLCSMIGEEGDYLGTLILLSLREPDLPAPTGQNSDGWREQRLDSAAHALRGLVHQLNNALAPIPLSAHLLRGQITPNEEAPLKSIETSVERCEVVLREALAFASGVGRERTRLQLVVVLRTLITTLREVLSSEFEVAGYVAPDLWDVKGNLGELKQAFFKLCINAREAMPAGGQFGLQARNVRFTEPVSDLVPQLPPGAYVRIEFRDTGAPIPPAIRDRVFEPFVTCGTRLPKPGFLLASVLGVVQSHGGAVEVQSSRQGGTAFVIYLPALLGPA